MVYQIWEFILSDVQSVNSIYWFMLGLIVVFVFWVVIYHQNQRPRIIEDNDTFIDREPSTLPPCQDDETKAWFYIDLCSVLTITPFIYLYIIKKSSLIEIFWLKMMLSFIIAILVYVVLVKPILFNTKKGKKNNK